MTRPWAYGPRSLIRTWIERPFSRLVTRTMAGIGRVLCAAVRPFSLDRSPLAVRLPWKPGPYQEATPLWIGLVSSAIAEVASQRAPKDNCSDGQGVRSFGHVLRSPPVVAAHNTRRCVATKACEHTHRS